LLRVCDSLSPGAHHLDPVSPDIHLKEGLSEGVWWVLESDRPLRMRIEGEYDGEAAGRATFSALAFEELR